MGYTAYNMFFAEENPEDEKPFTGYSFDNIGVA